MAKKGRYSFYIVRGGAGKIRGRQMADWLDGYINPRNDSDKNVQIWVKRKPDRIVKYTYCDIVDEVRLVAWSKKNPNVPIISTSETGREWLISSGVRKIIVIPEHHCNFERYVKPRQEVRTVGVIGGPASVQCNYDELVRRLKKIDLNYIHGKEWFNRSDVVDFYQKIDLQIIFRPWQPDPQLRNPLKLENAGSYGIPSISYPEYGFGDWNGYFVPIQDLEEMFATIYEMKINDKMYDEFRTKALLKSEEYHIDKIGQLYLQLGDKDMTDVRFSITADLLDKTVETIDGQKLQIYGLKSLRVKPQRHGIGNKSIKMMETLAEQNDKIAIVGFADPAVLPFYYKCGWTNCGFYDGYQAVSSRPIPEIKFKERW